MTEKFTIDVDAFIEKTKIVEIDLDQAFKTQSSLRAYYGAQAAQLEAIANKKRTLFDICEASVYRELREQAIADNVKITEKLLENMVKLDPRWATAKQEYIDAQCVSDIAKSLVASLVDRKDMLIQIGADRRDENKGAMRVLEIERQNTDLENLRQRARDAFAQRADNLYS